MKKISIILLYIFFTTNTFGQYKNPANKYSDAYKQFLDATCPIEKDSIRHFVYFSQDRALIQNHPLLTTPRLAGAQIMYSWRQLEPKKDEYDFSIIEEDLNYLLAHGKKLFVQFQDVSFSTSYIAIPDYLLTEEFDGGCTQSFNDNGEAEGWVAKRWNPKLQQRFALLMEALGKAFDGKIEGINLQESAAESKDEKDKTFTPKRYAACIKENMLALKKAFPKSVTMQYANFMPGEWLPWEDEGYLRSLYQYGKEIGVGLGGPDLMVQRKGQLNHLITMMHENKYTVPLGIAIQDGNYIGKTGADQDYKENEDTGLSGRKNLVPLLHAFAKDFLRINYMFWVNQEPYFSQDVLPCLNND
ncbi:hypothetical protein [Flexithrix dorotheae]|uniref:hypothetical protein n=1 Tax=Flexithrix dorotheae TaxID=70993 RepID=UPI000368EABD|nr:hypothetical protein [Flexithrix dorotheae]